MMSVITCVIDVVLNLMFVTNTKPGDVVLERSPIIPKNLSAVVEVLPFCTIPTEVQRRPDVAVM